MKDSFGSQTVASITDGQDVSFPVSRSTGLEKIDCALRRRVWLGQTGLFIASVCLFSLAITLMKEGARGLAPFMQHGFAANHAANYLGFGWLAAYLIMSGSPVAAAALAFFNAGAIDKLDTFALITGSRLGASFIVLFIGFIYVLRGYNRTMNLSMGLLSLSVTGTTYLVALFIGISTLQAGLLAGVQLRSGLLLNSIINLIFDPLVGPLINILPGWACFMVGLGIITLSFSLFDRCLPRMSFKACQVGRTSRLVYGRWVMFALGAAITLISMSVSISLGLLLPLSNRGFIRRENVIAYIMGANITTFIDTLLVAALMDNPLAFTIVCVQIVSIALVSILILACLYRRYERMMLDFVAWVISSNRNLTLFMITILLVPIILTLL